MEASINSIDGDFVLPAAQWAAQIRHHYSRFYESEQALISFSDAVTPDSE